MCGIAPAAGAQTAWSTTRMARGRSWWTGSRGATASPPPSTSPPRASCRQGASQHTDMQGSGPCTLLTTAAPGIIMVWYRHHHGPAARQDLGSVVKRADGRQRCAHSQEAVKNTEYWRLIDPEGKPPGFLGWWPSKACTFVDNHDTGWAARVASCVVADLLQVICSAPKAWPS